MFSGTGRQTTACTEVYLRSRSHCTCPLNHCKHSESEILNNQWQGFYYGDQKRTLYMTNNTSTPPSVQCLTKSVTDMPLELLVVIRGSDSLKQAVQKLFRMDIVESVPCEM